MIQRPACGSGDHQSRPLHARHGFGDGEHRLLSFRSCCGECEEADRLIQSGAVSFVVTVPSDFARRVQRGDHPQILIEADATDPSVASGRDLDARTVAAQALLREQSAEALGRPAIDCRARGRGSQALQSGRHHPVQHRAGSSGRDPATDHGDDDINGADAGTERAQWRTFWRCRQARWRSCSARCCRFWLLAGFRFWSC